MCKVGCFLLSMNRWAALGLVVLLTVGVAGCGSDSTSTGAPTASIPASGDGSSQRSGEVPAPNVAPAISDAASSNAVAPRGDLHPVVVIKTSLGRIQVRLDGEKAPRTVDNFLENYVDRKFYQGTTFHYVDKESMVIGGGFSSDGEPKETRAPIRNESDNAVKNTRGTLAMARHADYRDSATSQFFINLVDNPSLDFVEAEDEESDPTFGYCVFGVIVEGMDVVDRIAQAPVHDTEAFSNAPKQPIVIESIERVR